MNIVIQTQSELILLHTSSMQRALDVCKKGNVDYIDIYEAKDDELQYYCFSDRVQDPKYIA